jgi:DNA-binding XRE family transcriptional regulator
MIQNELQYRVTQSRLNGFRAALALLEQQSDGPVLTTMLERNASLSLIEDFQQNIDAYLALRTPGQAPDLNPIANLGQDLIKARIAAGLSQEELANRLHLKRQQIQRYEETAYASASVAKVQQVAQVLKGCRVLG